MKKLAILTLAFALTACGGGTSGPVSAAANPAGDPAPPAQVTAITADYVINMAAFLPPDPGPAADETLLGVDANGNGVRDEIERWIALEGAPDSAKLRAALMQKARFQQKILEGFTTQEEVVALEYEMNRVMTFLVKRHKEAREADRKVTTFTFNTYDRIKRIRDFERRLGGMISKDVYDLPDNELADIDPALFKD